MQPTRPPAPDSDLAGATGREEVDVVVVGGGVAGLSAAIALARFRRSVVVVDAGRPRNSVADGVHNYLGRDGVDPSELLAVGRAELERYGGAVLAATAVGGRREGERLVVTLGSGACLSGRRLVVASGTLDILPDVGGIEQRWGRDVVHCPYCHGWEVRDRSLGVLATNPDAAVHQAQLFAELSDEVRVFTHTSPPPSADQLEQLAALGIAVVPGRVSDVVVVDDRIAGVRMDDGRVEALAGIVVATGLDPTSAVLDELGVERSPDPPGGYAADAGGATSVDGVYVAGNVMDPYAPVVVAAASGMVAAGRVNGDLVGERARRALAASSTPERHRPPVRAT